MTGRRSLHVNAVTEVTGYSILFNSIGSALYVYTILITTGYGIAGYGDGVYIGVAALNTITGSAGNCVVGDADR